MFSSFIEQVGKHMTLMSLFFLETAWNMYVNIKYLLNTMEKHNRQTIVDLKNEQRYNRIIWCIKSPPCN